MDRINASYLGRAKLTTNPMAKQIFELMEQKKTNLVLANDETNSEKFFEHVELLGQEIAMLKTHIDIIEDFAPNFINKLEHYAEKYNFLIFEDRKFADIGNTVKMQYGQGVYKIAEWAHLTNAHIVPGPGIIEGLKETADSVNKKRGLILLAQMSSKGNLATDIYTKSAVELAEKYDDFVVGFIGNGGNISELNKLAEMTPPHFIILTPGVKIGGGGDGLQQQYTSPDDVIKAGSDMIIVGRGIYKSDDPKKSAQLYRQAGWEAYEKRMSKS